MIKDELLIEKKYSDSTSKTQTKKWQKERWFIDIKAVENNSKGRATLNSQ